MALMASTWISGSCRRRFNVTRRGWHGWSSSRWLLSWNAADQGSSAASCSTASRVAPRSRNRLSSPGTPLARLLGEAGLAQHSGEPARVVGVVGGGRQQAQHVQLARAERLD